MGSRDMLPVIGSDLRVFHFSFLAKLIDKGIYKQMKQPASLLTT